MSYELRLTAAVPLLESPRVLLLGLDVATALTHTLSHGDRTASLSVTHGPSQPGLYTMVVQDDGGGLPDAVSFERQETLGFQLMSVLSQQINAEIRVSTEQGTRVVVAFSPQQQAPPPDPPQPPHSANAEPAG